MARPIKTNADYFSHDVGMRNDSRIKLLRGKFGSDGWLVWTMLLEHIAGHDGFVLPITEFLYEELAFDFGLTEERTREILDFIVRLGLVQQDAGAIRCRKLAERLLPLVEKRENKREGRNPSLSVDKPPLKHGQTPIKDTSKVKESKGKERKESGGESPPENPEAVEGKSTSPVIASPPSPEECSPAASDLLPPGWQPEHLPIVTAFRTWFDKEPPANFRTVIQLLLKPKGFTAGALADNGKRYSGFTVEQVVEGIEKAGTAGHHSPNSLILHIAGEMKGKEPQQTKAQTDTRPVHQNGFAKQKAEQEELLRKEGLL